MLFTLKSVIGQYPPLILVVFIARKIENFTGNAMRLFRLLASVTFCPPWISLPANRRVFLWEKRPVSNKLVSQIMP